MSLLIKNVNAVIDSKIITTDILVENNIIKELGNDLKGENEISAKGLYAVPGFIDIHIHGSIGVDFNLATEADIIKICKYLYTQGVTSFFATMLTDTEEVMYRQLSLIQILMKKSECSNLMGVHLEGPFLSRQFKGAMPEHLLRIPDIEYMQNIVDKFGDVVKYMTIAPETEGAKKFIEHFKDKVTFSMGHSGADYDVCMEAIKTGIKSATHTGNGMKTIDRCQPSVLGSILESDIYAEIVCDGLHIHEGFVRLVLKAKGLSRVLLVTDCIMAGGLEDGVFKLGVNDVEVKDGDAKLLGTQIRAGSTLSAIKALQNFIRFTSLPLEKAIVAITENQAKLLNVFNEKGSIAVGKIADIVLLDSTLNVVSTISKGHII